MEGNAENKTSLLIGAVVNEKNEGDALMECIKIDKNFSARVQTLYNSTRDGRPLLKNVVRPLSHEGDISILELKKEAIRLSYFVDVKDVSFHGIPMKKAIVFLTCFSKHDNRATGREIIRAQRIRDVFLVAKAQGTLKKEEIYYG